MLRLGIIGYGRRISNMAKGLDIFDIPYKVTSVADPRSDRIQADNDPFLADARFYGSADELLAGADELDGIMIGTRCNLHTEMAVKVAPTQLPLFLEKPVSITFDEVRRLHAAYKDHSAPTVVSFPLRLSPVAQKVREIIESDQVGSIEQVVAFNDVGYGSVYFRSWYRNYEMDGGAVAAEVHARRRLYQLSARRAPALGECDELPPRLRRRQALGPAVQGLPGAGDMPGKPVRALPQRL